VIIIYAATNGYLDAVPVERARDYEIELFKFLDTRRAQLLQALSEKKELNDQIKGDLNQALKEFGDQFLSATKAA
jgi:F-type H+-transporting ATPase subunit alpha